MERLTSKDIETKAKAFDLLKELSFIGIETYNNKHSIDVNDEVSGHELTEEQYELLKKAGLE